MTADKKAKKKRVVCCDDCIYYDYDEYADDYVCTVSLDEDEAERFARKQTRDCPYYKFYDEYKSVQKQN